MDDLRLVLLLLGAGVVLAVYVWTRIQVKPRKSAASPTARRQQADDPGVADIDRELARMEQLVKGQEDAQPAADAKHPPPAAEAQRLIVVSVVASGGGQFSGETLLKAFEHNKLRFGAHDIYHRITVRDGRELPVFGVASMVKPGTFSPVEMEDFTTPGVTLFLQLPAPVGAVEAFDDFVHTAERLAVELGGELRDEQHGVLRHQVLMQLRESIVEDQLHRRVAS